MVTSNKKKANAYSVAKGLYDRVQHDERISSLGAGLVLEKTNDAHKALVRIGEEIDGWKPSVHHEKRAEAEGLMDEFGKNFELFLDFLHTLKKVDREGSAKEAACKRKDTASLLRLQGFMEECHCPPPLAAAIATELQPRGDRRVTESIASSPFNVDFMTVEDFKHPIRFEGAPANPPASLHWHKATLEAFESLNVSTTSRFNKGRAKTEKDDERTHGVCKAPSLNIRWNAVDEPPYFEPQEESMSPLMTVQSCWAFSNDLENQPMAGVGNFKIFLHGCLHVTFIEVAKVIESGQSIETLHAHINLHGVDSNPMFVVRRGQVLWFSIPPYGVLIQTDWCTSDTTHFPSFSPVWLLRPSADLACSVAMPLHDAPFGILIVHTTSNTCYYLFIV
jgi:hypothetical protein